MKKLLILVPAFPKNKSDSHTVPFIKGFLKGFNEQYKNVQLTIATVYYPKGKPYNWEGIKVVPLNNKTGKSVWKFFLFTRSLIKIIKLTQEEKYDSIFSFWYLETALLGNITSFFFSKKHFTYLQGQDVTKLNKFMRLFRPNGDKLLALSNFQNDFLFKEFKIKAKKVIPVTVNKLLFPELNTNDRPIDILSAGSFTPLKNHWLFLKTVLELKKTRNNIKAVLVGNGPLEVEFRNFITENHLENNISITGLLTHEETLSYINNAKVFLHTSTFEGGGLVCFEALYSGCQLISTLPIIYDPIENFYQLNKKKDILLKINLLLENLPPAKRVVYKDEVEIYKTVYNLLF